MNSLYELKELFTKNNIPVSHFSGWKFSCFEDEWTMAFGVFYCNGDSFTNKQINAYLNNILNHKEKEKIEKVFRSAKKIKPNKGYKK